MCLRKRICVSVPETLFTENTELMPMYSALTVALVRVAAILTVNAIYWALR